MAFLFFLVALSLFLSWLSLSSCRCPSVHCSNCCCPAAMDDLRNIFIGQKLPNTIASKNEVSRAIFQLLHQKAPHQAGESRPVQGGSVSGVPRGPHITTFRLSTGKECIKNNPSEHRELDQALEAKQEDMIQGSERLHIRIGVQYRAVD